MNTTVTIEPAAIRAWTEHRMIYLELTDGRVFGFPADRFQILSQASVEQLKKVQIELDGYALRGAFNSGIHDAASIGWSPVGTAQPGL
jgi:hypothetical protein